MIRPPFRPLLRLAALIAAATLAACATVPAPPAAAPKSEPLDAWARVLAQHVDAQGRVDFAAVARAPGDLDRYVAWVYANGPRTQPALYRTRPEVLAFHINAYNALSMYNVIASGIPESLSGLSKVRFFYLTKLQVDGEPLSLRSYENDIIRPLGDPRVHFALNCMSVSCPHLPRVPFDGATLDAQLERETRQFFAEPRNVRVDDASRTVYLSAILDFYTEDFLAQAPSLIAYVNRYRDTPIPADYTVRFFDYDWTVNRQPQP